VPSLIHGVIVPVPPSANRAVTHKPRGPPGREGEGGRFRPSGPERPAGPVECAGRLARSPGFEARSQSLR
jgi:hypothetical protein